jgi:N-acetylglucosaminyl-diphospho-decaprenol L-rhamnosyltransferase
LTTLSIVITSYETRDLLRTCLQSIATQTSPSLDYEVIVVDNASSDGSPQMVRDEFPDVRLLALDENLGFGAGCNRGAAQARGEYVALLNPDAELVGDTFSTLLTFARRKPDLGFYGGRSLHRDGSLDPRSCWALPTMWSTFCFATGLSSAFPRSSLFHPEALPNWQRDSVREVGLITGYLLLAHKAAWDTVGGFDEQFFLYSEDADLSLRARNAGYRPTITPDAVVVHLGGAASKATADKMVRVMTGKVTYVKKHWSGPRRQLALGLLREGVRLRAIGGSKDWKIVHGRRAEWAKGYRSA